MLKGILAISGHPGLFKLVTEGKNSIIVESLVNGKRMPAYSTSKISALADISVFTETGEIQLEELFARMKNSDKSFSEKLSADQLKTVFEEIMPEYDRNRVYISDIKKIFQWYQLLNEKDLLNEPEAEDVKSEETEQE